MNKLCKLISKNLLSLVKLSTFPAIHLINLFNIIF